MRAAVIEGKPSSVSRGNRTVTVGGDVVDSIIVTGDGNLIIKGDNVTLTYEGVKAEQIRKALDLLPPYTKSFLKSIPLIIAAILLIVGIVAAGKISYFSNLANLIVSPEDFTYSQLRLIEVDGTNALTQAALFLLTSWFILLTMYGAFDFDPAYLQKWLVVGTPLLVIGSTFLALPLTVLVKGYGSSLTFNQILTVEYYRAGGVQILYVLLASCMMGVLKLNRPVYESFMSHYRRGVKWDGKAVNALRSKAFLASVLIYMLGRVAIGMWALYSTYALERAIRLYSLNPSISDSLQFLWLLVEVGVVGMLLIAQRGLIDKKAKG